MIPKWTTKYLGLEYKERGRDINGVDCLGIVILIYKNEFGIELPDYINDYHHTTTKDRHLMSKSVHKNKDNWIKIDKPEEQSIIILNVAGYPVHMGVVLDDKFMIHTISGKNTTIERFTSFKWNKRIDGFYKWDNK